MSEIKEADNIKQQSQKNNIHRYITSTDKTIAWLLFAITSGFLIQILPLGIAEFLEQSTISELLEVLVIQITESKVLLFFSMGLVVTVLGDWHLTGQTEANLFVIDSLMYNIFPMIIIIMSVIIITMLNSNNTVASNTVAIQFAIFCMTCIYAGIVKYTLFFQSNN